jgi:hypothetical protein
MDQQATALAAHPPHWLTDAVIGLMGALAVITVAEAALPSPKDEIARERHEATALRGLQPVSVSAPAPAFAFADPVAGYEIISPFGRRKLPWEEHGRLHAGVDVAAPWGHPIQATADGVVTRAGVGGGYGRFVEIRHAEGLTSLYAHMGAVEAHIRPGTPVRLGDEIGQVGNTGSSTGAHLHFEIHDRRGRPLNPAFFLGRQFATADDLPLKAAARVPRGMRVAYVSYIPRKKRELMEARKAEKEAAEEATGFATADFKIASTGQVVRLTKAAFNNPPPTPTAPAAKAAPAKPASGPKPLVIHITGGDDDTPIKTWRGDPFEVGDDLPGWSGSSGG